ncbi:MAG: single-stranded DNA-binding protein [Bdellovibrionota bacterium]
MSLNRVFLLGNLGAPPELRYTQSQLPICTFRIATNERRQNQDGQWEDKTEWHTIVTFGKTAENCNQYLQKGKQCFVEGRIQTRKYQDQDGKDKYFTEIIASSVRFIGGGRGEGMEVERSAPQRSAPTPQAPNPSAIGETISFDDDDIPF